MLGRLVRTTRLDVGLMLTLTGITYLVWALVAGVARYVAGGMFIYMDNSGVDLPKVSKFTETFFTDWGFVIDLAGLAWLAFSLFLIALSSRQKIRAAWAWVSAICQSFVAGIGAVLVAYSLYAPYISIAKPQDNTIGEKVSSLSLPITLVVAVFLWAIFLVWLLKERFSIMKKGPSLKDGLRTHR